MGLVKKMERSGKRLLIKLATRLVRSERLTAKEILATPIERVLVIRQHNQMGDMLLAVPAFRAIKESIPGVRVAVISARINRDVLLNNPHVDRVLVYDRRNPLSLISLVREMRRLRCDVVIVLHTVSFSFTSAILGVLSGARVRVGSTSIPFGMPLSTSLYHLDLPLPSKEQLRHMNEAEHNLYPLRVLGIKTENLSPVLVPTPANQTWADRFLGLQGKTGGRTVAVHPGAGKVENIWPPEKFAEVVNRLAARGPIRLCVVEGPRDAGQVDTFCGLVRVPHTLLRDRPIGDVAAVLRRADLVLCNDTGIMHVACAAGATTLAVFGPTDPVRWAPICDNLHKVLARNGDLGRLSPDDVYERAISLLERVE